MSVIKKNKKIDPQSIIDLGYGPISRKKLTQLINEGKASVVDWKEEENTNSTRYQTTQEEDIAPVAEEPSWFQAGAFEDGYQFGDLTKTVIGTVEDVNENITTAIFDATENLIDVTAFGVGLVGGWFDEGFRDDVGDFIAKEILAPTQSGEVVSQYGSPSGWLNLLVNGGKTEENSVLGDKSDGLVQSGAHLAGSKALEYFCGIPSFLTMGVNAFGSELEAAFQQGATFEQAGNSAAISTAAELIIEKFSSGINLLGGKAVTDPIKDWLKKTISSKIGGTIARYAVDIAGEGLEEVATDIASEVGRKFTYASDKEWEEILSLESAFDSFIGGAVISGAGNAIKVRNSVKTGRDYDTGLTDSEEKVVNKLHEGAIANAEKNGTNLTKKQKSEIYDTIIDNLKHGQLNIEDIESVLGEDTYKSYKDTVAKEEALKTELKTLREMKAGDMTDFQTARMNQLKAMNLDDTTKRDALRKQLNDKVFPLVNKSMLGESYLEVERRKQKFNADLTQYEGKQKEAVERAINSGVLNDGYHTHKFVDLLSKIEAEKGIVFDYTNDEKLAASGFAIKDRKINGFENKGTVTLNVESPKALEFTVGHEVTHILEGTDSYSELQKALFAYAESKGELESRRAELTKLYKDINNADIDAELTADLVGDYLFNDNNFIKHLTGNRNLFQRIYDEIKYLYKIATGKEKTDIEKVKREFDKAWKELSLNKNTENEATDAEIDDVQYSVSVTDESTLNSLNEQIAKGEYNAETNRDGGYYVTYKSMSFWGYDEDGNAILRSPMAEYVDGELSNAYLIPKDKSKLNWYQSTETIDEKTGLPSGLMVKVKKEGNKSYTYLPAAENQDLIAEDWSNLYFNLRKKVQKNGKWVNSDVPARYNPYEHSSNSMLNDQFSAAYLRDNLVTVKMYVPISEDNGAFRAKWSKDPTGWADWKTGTVAGKINKQKDLQRKVYLSRYAAPVEIVPDSEVAQAYKEYLDGTDVTIPDNVVSPNLLNELKKAGVPITESGKVKNKGGVEYDKKSESYSPVKYSLSSWNESDYVVERQAAAKEMSKTLGITEEKATKYIDDVNSIAKMIANDKVRLSYEASPDRSSFVSNAEYGGSIDFSTICKKRRLLTGTFEAIQNALPNTALTAEEVLEIRNMMKDKGYEVSCGLCYVEGSRANMGQYTKQFIDRYKATNPDYVPNMAEMNTATGQEQIRKEHPEVYEAYEYFMNHYGRLSPTDKALFASQQKPKMYQMATEYKGEILDKFGNKKDTVDEKNKNGGLRLQSFSDFEIIHLIDSMQVIMDMSRVGLAGQAYTKVSDFAWAFGDTGLKINLSLIAKGVDENGRLILDEVEGMKESDAMALRDRYSDNVGTIIVIFNDAQFKAAMADERIDYIIPFHRSQWKSNQYEALGLPENTTDYTNFQNESYIEPVYNKNGKKQRPNNYMPNNYWDFTKSGKENAEIYLKMCAENNRKPKFSHLLVDNQDGSYSLQPDGSTDGYWKTLIDFKMYNNEGIGVPQNPVTPDFNMEQAQRMLNEYNGGHEKFPVAKDIVEAFVNKHPDNIAPSDVKYSISEDSNGNELSLAVQKRFANSKAVDENGNLKVLYHGTASGEFYTFDKSKGSVEGDFGSGFYFTDSESDVEANYEDGGTDFDNKVARRAEQIEAEEDIPYSEAEARAREELYVGGNKHTVYLNIENPAIVGKTNLFDYESYAEEYNREDYDSDEDYEGDVEQLIADDIDQIIWDIERNVDVNNTDGLAEILWNAVNEGGIGIEQLKTQINELYLEDSNGNLVGNEVTRQIIESLGYDGIIDNTVSTKFNMNLDEGTTHYIVFKPNQIKSIDNQNPTDDPDIRKSISNLNEQPSTVGTPLQDLYYEQKSLPTQENAPVAEDVAPVNKTVKKVADTGWEIEAPNLENIAPLPDEMLETGTNAAIRPKPEKQPSLKKIKTDSEPHIAEVLTEEPTVEKKKGRVWSKFKANFLDKGSAVEDLSLKTKNRALQDKYKSIGRSEAKAQYLMENGTNGVKSLDAIRTEVEATGHTKEFYEYLYHKHNVDRMSLEGKEAPNLKRLENEMNKHKLLNLKEEQLRAIASEKITKETSPKRVGLLKLVREYLASKDVKNKPVFDYSVTAEMSQGTVNQLESKYPKFKEYAQDVYAYMNHLRKQLVDNGVISQETADLWAEMYPNYVPIRREGYDGTGVNVPLDTNKTGINAPIKRATGGNRNILPLFDTMAQRTLQTFKATSKNSFGVELKNTLGVETENQTANLDDVINSIDANEELLQEGKNGMNPTFTVFENGERVTFEISDEMYEALKPTSEGLAYTNKVLNKMSNFHRGLLTEYNPTFMVTNAIKDAQDVVINSQHPVKTYANFPVAVKELVKKGKWFTEYMENGGGDNTYFDKQTNTFNKDEKGTLKKIIGIPLDKISEANNFIERMPRLAEYIASRKSGATVDAAMLDAARVTTDFSAGGDVTKFLNRNGATFLNASVQGFAQQVRNVREAKMNGLKGWTQLATKCVVAGLPAILLNGLLWDDDEDYEELSDYVKDNYYIVAKYGDGEFVRIPKGRTAAVIQEAFEQIGNTLTGSEETDWNNFFDLFLTNLAPNNPIDNNVIAPIIQVANNKTWYGEDLVPSRLQDLPEAEQYDESTDSISKWLGETFNISPYKINYLLNQYGGGVSDVVLPMLTPEAESGDNSFLGNMVAPLKDKFTTDSVMNNQNISDFYTMKDELAVNANGSKATDDDILKYKYINTVSSEIGDLYKLKREIQNSTLSDAEKYAQVREIQKQINAIAKESLNEYNSVYNSGNYANVGDKHYKTNDDGEWQKISDAQVEKQKPFVKVYGGYSAYLTYANDLYDIKADKDEFGKSITGSRKEKVINYLNNLDADYETKLILFKSEYPSDDTYNAEIIEYLNNREDLTYEERVSIFTELGFRVSDGYVYWD